MCGIFGIFNKNQKINKLRFEKALLEQKHRGPDNYNTLSVTDRLMLGHVRLSILDLSSFGNQPMNINNLSIVYNGEVFNYLEIRKQLELEGFSFNTQTDTEVVLKAYQFWGEDCVNHFNGMWSFCIFNSENNKLFCSRDRFGIKPFNYYHDNDDFLFSSEIKSIISYKPSLKEPNYNSIALYLRKSIGAENHDTWFKGIKRLPPAHNLIFNITSGEFSIKRYWSYPVGIINEIDFNEAKTEYLKLLQDSIKLRLRSDVPVGTSLSSGLDSSAIVSLIHKNEIKHHSTFTASFPGFKYDEYPTANKLTTELGYKSNKIDVDYNYYVRVLNTIIYHLESGHSSPAVYPLWFIHKKAKEEVTVLLEGQGTDELMGGYIESVFFHSLFDYFKSGKLKKGLNEIKMHSKQYSLKNALMLYGRNKSPEWLQKVYRKHDMTENIYKGPLKRYRLPIMNLESRPKMGHLNNLLVYQHQTTLVNLLHYGDAISMAHSIESRLPFMDYRLVEFVFSLPFYYKVNMAKGKFLHRESLKEIVPDYIINNRQKIGFLSPLNDLFKKKDIVTLLVGERTKKRKLFDIHQIKKILDIQNRGIKDYSRFLFRLLSTEIWFRSFIDK